LTIVNSILNVWSARHYNALSIKMKVESSLGMNLCLVNREEPSLDQRLLDPLLPSERCQLEKCENLIRRGFSTFFEVGQALLTIRDARLYREAFSTFEAYCHQRWGMGRSYAWHLIGAAARVRLLPPDAKTPRPANEFQVRPFLKLEVDQFPMAWQQVIARAKDGKITPALVRGVVAQMAEQKRAPKRQVAKKKKANMLPQGCSVGGFLVLLSEAKAAIQKGDTVKGVETIERLESELLGICTQF
jgi:hypothetical protein